MMLCLPLVYYVTHVEVYYRRQIDPMMLVLAVYAITAAKRRSQVDREREEAELQVA
jgi:uncharacterized membrane protein